MSRRHLAFLVAALVALVATPPDADAQFGPLTKKKNRYAKHQGGSGKGGTDSIQKSVWFVPGQKAKGILQPNKPHRLYFNATAGSKVTFVLESARPDQTTVTLLGASSMMPGGTFETLDDGTIELRDYTIRKTGGYFLLLQSIATKPTKVELKSSADWGLKFDDTLTIRGGKSRVYRIGGNEGRELKKLDIFCDDPSLVTVEVINVLGDPVNIKRSLITKTDRLTLRRMSLDSLGDYEVHLSVSPEAAGKLEISLVGEMTQDAAPKAVVTIR